MFRNPAFRGKQIYHVHIPKCAGDSLVAAIRRQCEPERVHIPDAVGLYLAARQSRPFSNEDDFERFQLELKQSHLLYAMNQGWSFISGHLPFSPRAQAHFGERYDVVTLLREPLERFLSHVIYLVFAQPRTSVEDYVSGRVDPADEVERLLHGDIAPWMASNLSLYLGGLGENGEGELAGRVGRAIDALDACALVGFVHRPEAIEAGFERRFGVRLSLARRNTLAEVQGDAALRERARRAIEKGDNRRFAESLVAADREVYEAARRKFPALA